MLIQTLQPDIAPFGRLLLFILGGLGFVLIGLGINRLLAPSRPNPEKLATYECGEDPIGDNQVQFNIRFYVVALIFLIFEVEILFLFPWATVFAKESLIEANLGWGILTMIEMVLFAGILVLGLAYVWKQGDLAWIKPRPELPQITLPASADRYKAINARYTGTSDYKHDIEPIQQES